MLIYVLALLIGIVAGLRAVVAPAALCWAARLGMLKLQGTPLNFLDFMFAPIIASMGAMAELLSDQLPTTPSRKTPVQFTVRLLSGGFCGAVLGIASVGWIPCAGLGVAGAIVGTLGGHAARARLARAFGGRDVPAGLLEDAVAIGGAALIVFALR